MNDQLSKEFCDLQASHFDQVMQFADEHNLNREELFTRYLGNFILLSEIGNYDNYRTTASQSTFS